MIQQFWHFGQAILGVILRHPVTAVSIIPRLQNGQIVLVKRRDTQRWSLPGGIVDWGQTLTETVHRELNEETGLSVIEMGRLVGIYSAPDRDPRMHSICVAIEAQVAGELCIQDMAEIADVQAFEPDDIPQDQLSHDHSRQLQDYWQGTTILA